MAALTKVLKTDIMADFDLKALAQVLRSKGRNGDTILAHITPKEARKLRRAGGSGSINPDTGLPEFYEGGGDYYDFGGSDAYNAATQDTYYPDVQAVDYVTPAGNFIVPGGEGEPFTAPGYQLLSANEPNAPAAPTGQMPTTPAVFRTPQPEYPDLTPGEIQTAREEAAIGQRGFFDRLGTSLEKQLSDPNTLARLGLGIGGAGLGLLQQQRGAKQAKRAREEMAAIGAPYRAQGQELIAQARAGELSPASAQAYQAAQAQLAQQTARQGGVGAAQAAATLERMRAQLLDNQYNLGLRVANIGDQYTRGAIQSGMQANQQLNQASTQFYTNLAATLSGPTVSAVAGAAR